MIVLIVPNKLKQKIEGIYKNVYEVKCTEDADGEWVLPADMVENENFAEIHDIIKDLPTKEFKEKIIAI